VLDYLSGSVSSVFSRKSMTHSVKSRRSSTDGESRYACSCKRRQSHRRRRRRRRRRSSRGIRV